MLSGHSDVCSCEQVDPEKPVVSASGVFVLVVLTQRLFGVLRSAGILNLAGSAVSPPRALRRLWAYLMTRGCISENLT
jgi:hypothetical protein